MRRSIARMPLLLRRRWRCAWPAAPAISTTGRREIAAQRGNWDEAVLALPEGAWRRTRTTSPIGPPCCAPRSRPRRSTSRRARSTEKAGVLERALVEYQQAVQLDPTNQYAKAAARARPPGLRRPSGRTARLGTHRADEGEDPRHPAAAAGAQPALEPADLARVPRAGVDLRDLPRPGQGVRHQRPVRSQPARTRRSPSSSRRSPPRTALEIADARGRPLLQGDRRAHRSSSPPTRRRTGAPTRTSSSRPSSCRTPRSRT